MFAAIKTSVEMVDLLLQYEERESVGSVGANPGPPSIVISLTESQNFELVTKNDVYPPLSDSHSSSVQSVVLCRGPGYCEALATTLTRISSAGKSKQSHNEP